VTSNCVIYQCSSMDSIQCVLCYVVFRKRNRHMHARGFRLCAIFQVFSDKCARRRFRVCFHFICKGVRVYCCGQFCFSLCSKFKYYSAVCIIIDILQESLGFCECFSSYCSKIELNELIIGKNNTFLWKTTFATDLLNSALI